MMPDPAPTVVVRDKLQICIFRSEQYPRLFALTRVVTGSNLPLLYGPWRPSNRGAMQGRISDDEDLVSAAILSAIEVRGFFLSRSDGNAW